MCILLLRFKDFQVLRTRTATCHSDMTGDFAKSSHDIRNYGQLAYSLEFVEQFSFQSWHRVSARQGNAWVMSRRLRALLEAGCVVMCVVML